MFVDLGSIVVVDVKLLDVIVVVLFVVGVEVEVVTMLVTEVVVFVVVAVELFDDVELKAEETLVVEADVDDEFVNWVEFEVVVVILVVVTLAVPNSAIIEPAELN